MKKNETNDKVDEFKELTFQWHLSATRHNYIYGFTWLGRPIIQIPQDIYAIQELVWQIQPDLIIETGIAHGGSIILSASLLAMLDYCDAARANDFAQMQVSHRRVLGIDIDIRSHNRVAIEAHPMSRLITMIEGSSVAAEVIEQVQAIASQHKTVLVFLDSNHTHEHVLAELHAYAPLTTPGSYCVVWDTSIEDLPPNMIIDRPWGKGNSPKTAVNAYLETTDQFELDLQIPQKLMLTAGPDGFLHRIK